MAPFGTHEKSAVRESVSRKSVRETLSAMTVSTADSDYCSSRSVFGEGRGICWIDERRCFVNAVRA